MSIIECGWVHALPVMRKHLQSFFFSAVGITFASAAVSAEVLTVSPYLENSEKTKQSLSILLKGQRNFSLDLSVDMTFSSQDHTVLIGNLLFHMQFL